MSQTWISNSSLLSFWRFENDYTDETGTYDGIPTAGLSFNQGYVGQAVYFKGISNQSVYTASSIPVFNKSFTMSAWVYPITLNNSLHSAICGICPMTGTDNCFHITFAKSSGIFYQLFGLYSDDVNSNVPVSAKNWMNIAITFNLTTRTVSHYRNGVFLRSANTASIFQKTGIFQIGSVPNVVNSVTTIHVRIEISTMETIKYFCDFKILIFYMLLGLH